ncbi:MAG: T9SS type A sorting domain-containing protein, partial [Bacteroidota bacterium]|nr:T9SS type A sorting domain-containing protein [Bacteroidota bacterium]
WDIAPCNDGGYIMCGETYCCNFTPGVGNTSSMWLVRTDSLGLLTGFNELVDIEPATLLGVPYPNPTSDYFEVSFTIPETQLPDKGRKGVEMLLFDETGKQIASQNIYNRTNIARFEMTGYAAGTYLLVLAIDGYNAGSRRVVKY